MNEKAEKTRAQICGMTHEEWKAAKGRSAAERTRGRVRPKRPMTSLWDDVDGQAELFPAPETDGGAQ